MDGWMDRRRTDVQVDKWIRIITGPDIQASPQYSHHWGQTWAKGQGLTVEGKEKPGHVQQELVIRNT